MTRLISFQVAGKGNLEEFQRLYYADNSRLGIQDSKGLTAAHKAAENGRVNILEFIATHSGGTFEKTLFSRDQRYLILISRI